MPRYELRFTRVLHLSGRCALTAPSVEMAEEQAWAILDTLLQQTRLSWTITTELPPYAGMVWGEEVAELVRDVEIREA